jgi:glutamate synthase domain-containing protein 2
VEQVVTVSRKKSFKQPKIKQVTINDARFGVRKFYFNQDEQPSIHVAQKPGSGPNGEHQN